MNRIPRGYLGNLIALSVGLFVAVIFAEVISRLVIPIFPGAKKLGLDGEMLNINNMQSGAVYRQYSEEYDALTTITSKGYRIPEATKSPEFIFLGDSFTFGQGLSDKETFPFLFCTTLQVSCSNLGVPGASTISELDRLETFLANEEWNPQHVFVFIHAMTQFMGAGNDLYDNIKTTEPSKKLAVIAASASHTTDSQNARVEGYTFSDFMYSFLDTRKTLLRHSNLARVVKFYFGPQLKKALAPHPKEDTLEHALSLMKEQLVRFQRLGEEHHFTIHLFLIHPIQDIMRGSYQDTIVKMQSISPKPIHSTAHLFLRSSKQYYFPLDGHLNPRGSKKIASYLLSEFGSLKR